MPDDFRHEKDENNTEEELLHRREFLVSLKKWSRVVIGGVLFAGALSYPHRDANAGWINRRGGGGGGWINGRGGGGGWINGRGGGGGGWINGRGGGGSWVNRW
jgi:hypothetical protein